MTSQELGSSFENITRDFFVYLLEKIGFVVTKARVQKAGTQNGFDILIMVSRNFNENKIFIECKNYESDLSIGNIVRKGLTLESNYELNEEDLFIAINPRSNFSNEDNSEKLSPILEEKFKFSYYGLELSNGVKELFALKNEIYKQVYGVDVDFEIDEEKEIKRFESIIFSRKPFKKIIIEDSDKEHFIGNLELDEHFLTREFSEDNISQSSFSLDYTEKKVNTLVEILKTESNLFILGNPGVGKTTELINFTLLNWKVGEIDGYVPIFKSLKNFTNTDTIENYLPNKWIDLNNILFVLDGIDEIVDIEYFKSKLSQFINKVSSKKKYKFIISCRTNVYESLVKDISGFKKVYLKELTRPQSIKLLESHCGSVEGLNIDETIYGFLKTPFQVKILANYINRNRCMPNSTVELWHTYIDERLSHDKNDKLKKISLNTPVIKKFSKKTAVISELMKSNLFTEDNLFSIVKDNNADFIEFKKNPLIDKLPDVETYFFEHRNIQEYFASELMSNLSIEQIKKFILIPGTNKTHPSLFNTITFLINILNSETYELLVDWLVNNEPELLFKADRDRTGSFRVRLFQNYFQRECIEKTFWIFNNRTFTVKEIAEFGDCEQNFDYLNSFIIDEKNHFRVIISALELLSFFNIPAKKLEKLKQDLFEILSKDSTLEIIKSNIVDFIYDQKICKDDAEYLKNVFELFKSETSKQINRSLLSLVEDVKDVDSFFWYIEAEFLREKKITERIIKDEVIRGNSYVLERIIVRLESSGNFIDLVKYYLDESRNSNHDRRFADEIVDRCLYFDNLEDDFLIRLISSIDNKVRYYFRENLFKRIILESKLNSRIKAFDYLLKNYLFNNIRYSLASIVQEETLHVVIENFVDGTLESSDVDIFRNAIANHGNRKLAEKFNNILIKNGFIFNQPFLFEDEFKSLKIEYEKRPQKNFDLLFEKELLLSEIREIFNQNGENIDSSNFHDIELKWYDENGHSGKIDISYTLLSEIVYEISGTVTFMDVEKALDNDFLIIDKIKSELESKNNPNGILVKENQKEFLYQWFEKTLREVKFDKIIEYVDINRFNLLEDYHKLKYILFFNDKFNFNLSEDFLLNAIEFFDIDNFSEKDDYFENLSKKINNKKLLDERITSNLINKKMYYVTLSKHIQYALDKKLTNTYDKIKEHLLSGGFGYNLDEKITQYFNLTKDIDFLKMCCQNIKSHICWTALRIMVDLNIENDFCFERAIEYLESEIDDEKNYYYSNALAILFQLNKFEALEYVNTFLVNERSPSLKEDSFTNYDVIKDYSILEYLFEKIYMGDRDRISFSGLSSFLTTYISNLSKTKMGFDKTQDTLNKIKIELTQIISDHGLFYINLLIDTSNNSYINSRSKPLTFKEALLKVEEILN